MGLEDSINSMASLSIKDPDNIINHVTEKFFSINEIAEKVLNASKRSKINNIEVNYSFDLRKENIDKKLPYNIVSNYINENVKITDFEETVYEIMQVIIKNSNRIDPKAIEPSFNW